MRTIGRKIPRSMRGSSTAICATCSARFYRRQLVRGTDGLLRCYGPGTFNDHRGLTEDELNAKVASASMHGAMRNRGSDDPGELDLGGDI